MSPQVNSLTTSQPSNRELVSHHTDCRALASYRAYDRAEAGQGCG
jgi:hypothetical protein